MLAPALLPHTVGGSSANERRDAGAADKPDAKPDPKRVKHSHRSDTAKHPAAAEGDAA
jgi:hypothetical protein